MVFRCSGSGRRCTWTPRSRCRSGWRRTLRTHGKPGRPAKTPSARMCRLRNGRPCSPSRWDGQAGHLPPAGRSRGGTSAVGYHHDRLLPAGPCPGHGTALAHMLRDDALTTQAAAVPNPAVTRPSVRNHLDAAHASRPGPGLSHRSPSRHGFWPGGLPAAAKRVSRRALRSDGIMDSNKALNKASSARSRSWRGSGITVGAGS
jgi:hypothetical protein